MLKQQTGRSPSLGNAVLTGTSTAAVAAFFCSALLSGLVDREMMRFENIGYGILAAHLIAVFLGGKAAISRAGKQGAVAAGVTGAAYYLLLLLVNAMFFGGSYTGLGTTLLLVVLGMLGAVGTSIGGRGRKPRRRYKIPK